jgi:hypothetical protein
VREGWVGGVGFIRRLAPINADYFGRGEEVGFSHTKFRVGVRDGRVRGAERQRQKHVRVKSIPWVLRVPLLNDGSGTAASL